MLILFFCLDTSFDPSAKAQDRLSSGGRKQKLFMLYYCFFGIHESSISSLKIKSAKTTSKRRSTARAVRTMSSTRGLLPLCFFVVFYAFYLRAAFWIVKHSRLVSSRRNAQFILYDWSSNLSFWRRKNPYELLTLARLILVDDFLFHAYSFLLSWYKRNKRSSLKIKSAKTTSKRRSTARAVRTTSSTRGLLPLCFFVVFYAFYLRAVLRIVKHSRLVSIRRNA